MGLLRPLQWDPGIQRRLYQQEVSVMAKPEHAERESQIPALQKQIAVLRSQRRSSSTFRVWKADIFYYLFSIVASAVAAFMAGGSRWGYRSWVAGALCFGLLCCFPAVLNRLRYLSGWGWPNSRLEMKIAALDRQIKRMANSR